jgi:hypothetical protein
MRAPVVIALLAALRTLAGAGCQDQVAECVPGGNRVRTDCHAEWLVANPSNDVPSARKALSEQRCVEGDPNCDFDGGGTGAVPSTSVSASAARTRDCRSAAPRICVGGANDGVDCTTSSECPNGTCQTGQPIGVSVPTLRGIWDTFPLLQSGAAGFTTVGGEPSFTPGCSPGSNGCCSELVSPVTPLGHPFTGQHLEMSTRDPIMAVLTTENPLGQHGGDLSTLTPQQVRDLDAFLRSL